VIAGVIAKPLKVIPDERGFLMEIVRADDPFFDRFGQAYLSVVYPGIVKGWHYHKLQTDRIAIVRGMAKIVLCDRREESPSRGEIQEFFAGDRNPLLLVIPPGVCHGMKGIGTEAAFMINIPTHTYDYEHPDEYRLPPHDGPIPYDWSCHDG
jgi:dTDP-4-dehydrorhamnose 3,5-epimerase